MKNNKAKTEDKDLLKSLMEERFLQIGGGNFTLKTSADLAREFGGFLEVSPERITKMLLEMKTEIVDIDGKPFWKLYTKE